MAAEKIVLEPPLFEVGAKVPLRRYHGLRLLLDSLTLGPRPNFKMFQARELNSYELYLLRRESSLLVPQLTFYLRQARERFPDQQLQACDYYLERLFRDAYAKEGHHTLRELLLQQLGMELDPAPPADIVERICEAIGMGPMSWQTLLRWQRSRGQVSFSLRIHPAAASVAFFERYPVETRQLLARDPQVVELNQSGPRYNNFFYELLSYGQDEAVLYLCRLAHQLGLPAARRDQILQAAYLTAVAVAEPLLARQLRVKLSPEEVVEIASLAMLEYLEVQQPDFHQVPPDCQQARLEAAVDTADVDLFARLLELYPDANPDVLTELICSAGSVEVLEVFEARYGQLELSPEDLEAVGHFGCRQLAFYLCDANPSLVVEIERAARLQERAVLAADLRTRYPAQFEAPVAVSDD